jgi:hypothetical protein
MKTSMLFSLLTATVLVSFLSISGAVGQVIYDSIPSPLPGNVPSLGFSCCGLNEVGDQIQFAGTNRRLNSVTVTMSDWACQEGDWTGTMGPCITTSGATFSHPITLNIYDSSLTLLATKTQDFNIPYRPSQDPATCGPETHTWYDPFTDTCVNGLAFNITFDLSSLNVVVPDEIIFGVTYNTSNQGYSPLVDPGPYDSLNVGLRDYTVFGPPLVGTDANSNAIFLSCTNAVECAVVSALLHEETGWTPYTPAISFTSALPVPMTKNDCKKGGWRNLFRADGTPFKNQGKCIQYVNTGKGSPTKNDCKKGGWQNLFRADGTPFKNQSDCIQYFNTGK